MNVLTVSQAFRQARIHAVRHMAACEEAGLRWGETSVTEIVLGQASRAVRVAPFTPPAEALSGADWIWWWVDRTASYGMLVQAKRVTIGPQGWKFNFGYRGARSPHPQRDLLHTVAAKLGLLPVYALYLGTGGSRGWEPCSDDHTRGRCLQCIKRSVSLMPELLANDLLVNCAATTYESSVALEDISTPSASGALVLPALQRDLDPALQDFLSRPQRGVRAVTRSMIDPILLARYGAFSALATTSSAARVDHENLGRIFARTPVDTGHWGLSYFEHALRPLVHAPPH